MIVTNYNSMQIHFHVYWKDQSKYFDFAANIYNLELTKNKEEYPCKMFTILKFIELIWNTVIQCSLWAVYNFLQRNHIWQDLRLCQNLNI